MVIITIVCYKVTKLICKCTLEYPMQVLSSLKSAKKRHPDCQIVKRRGRVYVICKSNPRFKAVQGKKK